MEPKWPMLFVGDWTPQTSSSENMTTGCLSGKDIKMTTQKTGSQPVLAKAPSRNPGPNHHRSMPPTIAGAGIRGLNAFTVPKTQWKKVGRGWLLGCPRKLGWKVSKRAGNNPKICHVQAGYNPVILTIDPEFLGHPSTRLPDVSPWGSDLEARDFNWCIFRLLNEERFKLNPFESSKKIGVGWNPRIFFGRCPSFFLGGEKMGAWVRYGFIVFFWTNLRGAWFRERCGCKSPTKPWTSAI